MATVLDRITRALRLIRVLEAGESPSADDANDSLAAFNAMLGSWDNDKLMAYATRDESITLVNGQASYTMGPTGDLVTDRPLRIENAYIREAGTDYSVQICSRKEWDAISDKTAESDIAECVQFEGTMPDSTIQIYPVPNTANTLHVRTRIGFDAMVLTDTMAFPQGYTNAIDYNLAVYLAPEFFVEVPQAVVMIANKSMAAVKRTNARPIKATQELAMLFGNNSRNIETDGN